MTVGALELAPEFDAGTFDYACETSNASNKVTATAAEGVTINLKLGDDVIENESSPTWKTGVNVVKITASKNGLTNTYTVTVTKN